MSCERCPDLPTYSLMQFRPLKQHLGGHRFHDNEEVEVAVCERMRKQRPCFSCSRKFMLCQDNVNESLELC